MEENVVRRGGGDNTPQYVAFYKCFNRYISNGCNIKNLYGKYEMFALYSLRNDISILLVEFEVITDI